MGASGYENRESIPDVSIVRRLHWTEAIVPPFPQSLPRQAVSRQAGVADAHAHTVIPAKAGIHFRNP